MYKNAREFEWKTHCKISCDSVALATSSPVLVAKCEQILCATTNEQQSQNLLLKVELLSTICNKLITQDNYLKHHPSWEFLYRINIAAFKTSIYKVQFFVSQHFGSAS